MDIFCGLLETAEPSREYHDENRMTSRPQTPTEGAEAQSTVPLCRNCKDPLVSGSDTYKKDGKFLMNCKACRDATAKRRKRNYAKNCQFSIVRGRNKKRKVNSPPSKDPTPPPPADPECTICADTFPAMDLISLSECTHEPDVCHECFLSWLTQQMESTAWDRIACPSTNCTKTLSHDDIKATAPADIFARSVLHSLSPLDRHTNATTDSTTSPHAPSSAPTHNSATVSPPHVARAKSMTTAMTATFFVALRAPSLFARRIILHSTRERRVQRMMSAFDAKSKRWKTVRELESSRKCRVRRRSRGVRLFVRDVRCRFRKGVGAII